MYYLKICNYSNDDLNILCNNNDNSNNNKVNSNGKNRVHAICNKFHCVWSNSWFSQLTYYNLYQQCITIYDWILGRECSVGKGAACDKQRGGFPRICFFFFVCLLIYWVVLFVAIVAFVLFLSLFFIPWVFLWGNKVLAHHPWSLFRGLLPYLFNTNTILSMSLFQRPPKSD